MHASVVQTKVCQDPEMEEAITILMGMKEARRMGCLKIVVETDCLVVVQELCNERKRRSDIYLVNNSLDMAITRLDNAKEERSQFHEANNTIIQHLQMKEKELSTYITSCKTEAGVIVAWNKFIEHAWDVQYSLFKKNKKQVINELKKYGKLHVEMILHTLKTYENVFRNMVGQFKVLARRLKLSEESDETFHLDDDNFVLAITRKTLEEEYLQFESQLINAFAFIESIQETYRWGIDYYREHEEEVRLLLEIFTKIKEEFESLERPNIEEETIDKLSWKGRPLKTRIGKKDMIDTLNILEYDEETPKTESAKCIEEKFKEEIVDWEFDAIEN
ncbi:uncharacterized protein LOC141640896 [Silene latifolia]|uniref:uncharacterized protein LOC141640896 n=1 Tax=Silene latifolia TaxID=37657 RepID=UPI003D77A62C